MEECEIVSNSFSMGYEQHLLHEIVIHSILKGLFKLLLTILHSANLTLMGTNLETKIQVQCINLGLECLYA